MLPGFDHYQPRYGDIHNHNALSYGTGRPEDALANARLQLDFVSLTVHGAWPDPPSNDPDLAYLVDYHTRGFERAHAQWDGYVTLTDAANEPGRFVTLPSFEWHSMQYGDHCVYFKDGHGTRIVDAPDLPALRTAVRTISNDVIVIPHHIGYQHGYRGIHWDSFDESLSPVAEIMSFHGSAESCDGPLPYLHAMGPRDGRATARHGWRMGHRFGIIGSTDHHAAVPGAYGYGRLGAWMHELTRDALWDALLARRTWALTGDRIDLAFHVNGIPMGSAGETGPERTIEVAVRGGDGIDYVDVLHDERIVHRHDVFPVARADGHVKVHLEVGWGERDHATPWDVTIDVDDGQLANVEPRFRGPLPSTPPREDDVFAPHTLHVDGPRVHFTTRTWPNPHSALPASEGVCLELDATPGTTLHVRANGHAFDVTIGDLIHGSRSEHVGGFVSPAVRIRRAIHDTEFATHFTFSHRPGTVQDDLYRIRVRQRNDQWAWSSPVWIDATTPGKE